MRQFSILSCGILIGFVASSAVFVLTSTNMLEEGRRSCNHVGHDPNSIGRPKGSNQTGSPPTEDSSGWKDIHIFFGSAAHLKDASSIPTPYFHANKWFSQFRQDEIVSRLLSGKRGGYFIDLAANDPVRISNTYALETHFDWSGLCLEPNPVYWSGLSYRKCHVVGAVIGNQRMDEIYFRFPKDKAPQGGILGDQFDNKKDNLNEGHSRYTVTLLEIFDRFHVPTVIDYISLDIEGAEEWVMSSFPFSQYRFNVMTVERPSSTLSQILTINGYIQLKAIRRATETLWVHQAILEQVDMTALEIDSQNYKYRENTDQQRIAPEETTPV
jgi:Methyltransferase FkbM domain